MKRILGLFTLLTTFIFISCDSESISEEDFLFENQESVGPERAHPIRH